ncbi:DDE Tnp4 domain-containing protein [Pseudoscourfieldia marina]
MSSFLSSSDSSSDSDDSDSDSDESLLDLLFPYTGNLDPGLQALKDAELSSVGLPPGCAPKNFGRCRRVVGRTGNLNRNRAARLKDMLALRPREFRARYRMSIGTFTKLVNKVRAKLSAPFPKKGRAGGTVQPELQLAIALRWFAGGQMLDVAPLHGVAWNTAWVYVHRVMDASTTFNINFGTDVEELKRRAAEFFELSKSTVDGCVGALDGIVFKMKKPRRRDIGHGNVEENVGNYWCRKGFYGVAMQAIVDAKLRFLWLGGFAAGCTNDVHAFGMTQLAEALQKGILPARLAGDEAYVCTDSLIVPYSSSSRVYATNASCDDFNFYLSRIRITVERAFGVLVGRWGIFEANRRRCRA